MCSQVFKYTFKSKNNTSKIESKLRQAYKLFVISGHFDAVRGKTLNGRENYKLLLTYHA